MLGGNRAINVNQSLINNVNIKFNHSNFDAPWMSTNKQFHKITTNVTQNAETLNDCVAELYIVLSICMMVCFYVYYVLV